MTYDKQDLLLTLRKLAAMNEDTEVTHATADEALLKFIDDEHISEAFRAIPRWYA